MADKAGPFDRSSPPRSPGPVPAALQDDLQEKFSELGFDSAPPPFLFSLSMIMTAADKAHGEIIRPGPACPFYDNLVSIRRNQIRTSDRGRGVLPYRTVRTRNKSFGTSKIPIEGNGIQPKI